MLHHKKAFQFFVLLVMWQLHGAESKDAKELSAQALSCKLAVAQERAQFASAPPSKIHVVEYATQSEKARAWAELADVLQPFLDDSQR